MALLATNRSARVQGPYVEPSARHSYTPIQHDNDESDFGVYAALRSGVPNAVRNRRI